MKRRNPYFGCRKIAEQISNAFGIELNKDVVRRILIRWYRPGPDGGGPSWLSIVGQARDRLWSVDLFRTESILLKSYWVMVVMDVYTRRIVGFGVAPANLDGIRVCRMFNRAIARQTMPRHLSSDHDPLFRFHRWRANLRILEVDEIKTIPNTPRSHAFVERLIGTIRREYLDRIWFWHQGDLERKLEDYKTFYNDHRCARHLGRLLRHQRERFDVEHKTVGCAFCPQLPLRSAGWAIWCVAGKRQCPLLSAIIESYS
jgi:putative transposase